ncbi:MAG TPA: SurA N-terminal domain-containing protein [Candidatus Paceibacterota bacterium]|jgi:parvulin-like peptidyl-prolyl isomerase|nr:SurA N-terminal domain-containing protein [Candidatus Paceibacterota bacterium]HMO82997.1 SurA N-terminal domain-containing protein [Candidatus Paceibacterota bacterium]
MEQNNETITVSETEVAKRPISVTIGAIVLATLMVCGTLLYINRGVFIAATVDGSPIYRLTVLTELEKQGGAQALDTLITDVLLEKEFASRNITLSDSDIDAEIKKIEEQVSAQGGTLEAALAQQGMTMTVLREQITIQKKLELALQDKVAITDEELQAHIKESGATVPEGAEGEAIIAQIKDELKQQKFQSAAQTFVSDLKSKAEVVRYVTY